MNLSKRRFMQTFGAAAAMTAIGQRSAAAAQRRYDLLVIGAGTAGIPAAIFAAARGASVLVLDTAATVGGTLLLSSGQISAAGTRVQRQMGIVDTPDLFFQDLMRISRGTIDQAIARLAVDHAATTVDWLMDNGYELLPGYPVKGIGHEPYSNRRYYWSTLRGIGILNAMKPHFVRSVEAGKIDLRLEHRAVALSTDRSGAVVGVVAEASGGKRSEWRSRNVLLASGGYASNTAMFEKWSGFPKYLSGSYPFSLGEGHQLAESVGGYMRYAEKYLTNFGVLLATSAIPSTRRATTIFDPQLRQPWEIYVNSNGQRFVREDLPSVDAREHAFRHQPHLRHWVVLDHAVLQNAPPILEGWTQEDLAAALREPDANFFRGDTLAALAEAAGLPGDMLAATIEAYNYGVETGNDFFGRKHLPTKLQKPPFYAIRHQGTSITSTAGIAVNEKLQVLRRDQSPVPNLYAAGEILGAGATQGQAFCGGMMVTPALTFGRLLGERLIPLS